METIIKKDIRKAPDEELISFFEEVGEKPFRLKQVKEWIWEKSAINFDDMTNISLSTREKLKSKYDFLPIHMHSLRHSNDGTIKCVHKLYDGALIESVLIPVYERITACVSSQVGCSLNCKFCATGYLARDRNLDAAEIYDQVVAVKNLAAEQYDRALSNIVFMGMGEPLLNYNNVMRAIEKITSKDGLHMSASRITLSTSGISKMIEKLADDGAKFNLALSLHSANDAKRSQIMPINDTNNLQTLKDALIYFYAKTKNDITLEYCVWKGFNDTLQDADELYKYSTSVPCKINLIEYNAISEANFMNTDAAKMDIFYKHLLQKGAKVTIRKSRGRDIDAACGQLAGKITPT
ncbi:MAG: 23S rRNA (adenine(2503)-C(2))-methyltransferase RlmN [Cytophagales bacterium]|nr:23S rRNA (adenine(2503)-C(2))-methyltransferase RlmN [Cytophagales bacterium]